MSVQGKFFQIKIVFQLISFLLVQSSGILPLLLRRHGGDELTYDTPVFPSLHLPALR